MNEDFLKEIKEYSIDELELIYETQKDLYTIEEMDMIRKQIELLQKKEKKAEKEKIEKMLPKEIKCSKCEGPNSFKNDTCIFCGATLEKSKYYNLDYYSNNEDIQEREVDSNTFRYVISFLIPLVGYILGAILLSKDNADEKSIGKSCIVLGIVSTIIGVIISVIVIYSNI